MGGDILGAGELMEPSSGGEDDESHLGIAKN